MKYWNTRHWENWAKIVDCLATALSAQTLNSEPDTISEEQLLPELSAIIDYSDIAGLDAVAEKVSPPVEEQLVEEVSHADSDDSVHGDSDESELVEETPAKNVMGAIFADARELETQQVEAPEPEDEAVLPPQTSQDPGIKQRATYYFSLIPWAGVQGSDGREKSVTRTSDIQPPVKSRTSQSPATPLSPSAMANLFFSAIPWEGVGTDGSSDDDSEVLRISVNSESFDAGLDIRNSDLPAGNMLAAGLRSAARTSDQAPSTKTATPKLSQNSRVFFNAIPW